MRNNHSIINNCPITGDSNQVKYFDLGKIPLVNNLCNSKEEAINCDKFPLNVNYYENSGLSSLDFVVDSELLFSHYLFKSSVNIPYYKHCQEMFNFLKKYFLSSKLNIADIGGNDGTLLEAFRSISEGCELNLLNIDPSKNLTKICEEKQIPVLNKFFSLEVAQQIEQKFDIVVSTNVFQHLREIESFTKGVKYMMSDNGIWLLEFPYWISDMDTNQFDQIYHEHVYYYSVKPINLIMKKNGLKIINITKQNIHGGTLRVLICREESNLNTDETLQNYLNFEDKYDMQYHIKWGEDINKHINKSKDFIKNIKKSGKSIYGFGAAAKGCIYLNAMNLDSNDIDYIIDDTDIKQGKFVPGVGIEIVSRDILKSKKPDYILILAHNFKDYIIESLNDIYDGDYIVLIPESKIIKNNDKH